MTIEFFLSKYNYWICIILMMIGFYGVIARHNLIKKLLSLGIFQTSVLLLYISASHVRGAHIPILEEGETFYANPLPHVLMLTAIVVGLATLAVGMAIAIRIKEEYGTIEEDEILAQDNDQTHQGVAVEAIEKPAAPVKKAAKKNAKKPTKKRAKKT